MMRFVPCLLAVSLMTAGCGWFTKSKNSTAAGTSPATAGADASLFTNNASSNLIVTPDISPMGTVARVNVPARFVILTFPVGTLPSVGTELFVYRHGLKVGEVKVTPPQNSNNTAADIVAGEAAIGDETRTQ
jgi:hypothetical protein